jgi:KDO2-lipid IV(A) lauroyltransferase
MNALSDLSLRRYLAPRYWPTWLLLAVMRVAARLPLGLQLKLGAGAGRLFRLFKRREAEIARKNLAICFPELGTAEREALLKRHFRSVGISLIEMGFGWFAPLEKLKARVEIRGLEHLERALEAGRGALLVTAHFTPIEVGVCVLEGVPLTINAMYRIQRNAMMDYLVLRGRGRFAAAQIPRDNVRMLIRLLKRNEAVLYMPDQTYLGNQSALVPFFGEPAMTNVATSKIAKISGAPVLPYWFRRKPDETGYEVEIEAPLTHFPTDDAVADTKRLVALLESRIRATPEQYLWVYKKFKHRPSEYPDPYANQRRSS